VNTEKITAYPKSGLILLSLYIYHSSYMTEFIKLRSLRFQSLEFTFFSRFFFDALILISLTAKKYSCTDFFWIYLNGYLFNYFIYYLMHNSSICSSVAFLSSRFSGRDRLCAFLSPFAGWMTVALTRRTLSWPRWDMG